MIKHLKVIILVESLVIAALLIAVSILGFKLHNNKQEIKNGLLSPRVYSGILEPKSLLVTNYAPLRKSLDSFINENNLTVSVYVENLRNGAFTGVNERVGFPAASISKMPLAILIMKKVDDGKLSLDTMIEVNDSDKTSTWGNLYKTKDKRLPLRVVFENMLKESDNTAFNILRHYSNPEDMAPILSYVDYYSEEAINAEEGGEELITPKSIYNLYSSLYLSTILEPQSSEYILSLLTNTTFDIKKIAELPGNVTVAHKFGARYIGNVRSLHDCGIIYNGDSRLFYCVMTKDLKYDYAVQVIGAVVNKIFYYSLKARETLDQYKELDKNNNK